MRRTFAFILAAALAALAGCRPAGPPPPSLTAPAISGVYTAALEPAIPAAAMATAIWLHDRGPYGVMLCMTVHDPEMLCRYPPPGAVTVK